MTGHLDIGFRVQRLNGKGLPGVNLLRLDAASTVIND